MGIIVATAFAVPALFPTVFDRTDNIQATPSVQRGATAPARNDLVGVITYNIPSVFNAKTTLNQDFEVNGKTLFNGDIQINNKDLSLGTGKLTASNVLYGVTAGENITISGDPQNPTISAQVTGGVTSLQGQTGALTLAGGTGITVSGTTITNSDTGSAQNIFKNVIVGSTAFTASSNTDSLTFEAGSGITITPDTNAKKLTISSNGSSGSSGSSTAFDLITSGTNTQAAMIVSSGSSLGYAGSGTIDASTLQSFTWESPGAIGLTASNSGAFTTLTAGDTVTFANLGAGIAHIDASGVLSSADLDLAGNTSPLSGVLRVAHGGTGVSATPDPGQLLIGNGTDYTLGFLTGTTNQVNISNGAGSITFSLPQDIDTAASPTFASLNLSDDTDQIVLGTGLHGTLTMDPLTADREYRLPDAGGVFCMSSGNCGNGGGGGTIAGAGITNYIAKFTSSTGISESSIFDNGKIGIGTATPQALLTVNGATTGKALTILNYTGSGQDILVGSSSGSTVFAFDSTGNLNLVGGYKINGTDVLTSSALGSGITDSSLTSVGALTAGSITSGFGNIDIGNDSVTAGDVVATSTTGFSSTGNGAGLVFSGTGSHEIAAAAGTLLMGAQTLNGAVTGNGQNITGINNFSADGTVTVGSFGTGIVQSDSSGVLSSAAINLAGGSSYLTGALPTTNGGTGLSSYTTGDMIYASGSNTLATIPIGSEGQVLSVSSGTPAWMSGSSLNYWQRNSGTLAPINTSEDLLIGGAATSSALFQISGTSGNATTSGNLTFNTTGTIQTTKHQTLTLGGSTTGNIILSPINGNGIVSSTGTLNLNSGKTYQINGINVLTASALGTGVTGSSLTSVGALASGSIASGFGTISTTNTISTTDDISGDGIHSTGGLYTGAGAGTIRLSDTGNLVNIGTTQLNGVTYTWPGADGSGDYVLATDGVGGLTWKNVASVNGAGDITAIGDVTSGAAFTAAGTQGTSLYFYDVDGRGQLTSANLTQARTYTLPDASGTVCLDTGNCAGVGGSVVGTGTAGQLTFFTGAGNVTSETTGLSWDTTMKRLGIGTDSPTGKLTVTGASTGKALVVLDETGGQDILAASASGTTVAYLTRSGDLAIDGQLSDISQNVLTVNDSLNLISGNAFQINNTTVLSATALGTLVTDSSLTSVGALSAGSIANGFGSILTGNTIQGTDITATGTTGLTASGDNAGLTFSGNGNHVISASSGTLILGATTLGGAISGNSQDITGLNDLAAGGTVTFGGLSTGIVKSDSSGVLSSGNVNLESTDVSGVLPIYRGGTNNTATGSAGTVVYSDGSKYTFTAVGSSGQVLSSNGSGAPTWIDAAGVGTNYWQRNAGAVAPLNITDDLLIGGSATSSAKFQIVGTSGNATTSGTLTFNANGVIQTTANKTLTFGGDTTGNITFSPLNGAGTVTVNGTMNLSAAKTFQIAGTDVLSATTLGSGVTGSQLQQVGVLSNGSIASGFGSITTINAIEGSTLAANGNGAGLIFSGSGNHDITASGGTLRVGAVTLNGAVSGNGQNVTGVNDLGATGTVTFGAFGTGVVQSNGSGVLSSAPLDLSAGASYITNALPIANGGTNSVVIGSAGSVPYSNGTAYVFTGVGGSGQVLTSNGSGAPTWTDAAGIGTNYWQLNNGTLAPANITNDLLLGGASSTSAKFGFLNVAGGTPTASIAGSTSGNALTMNGDGTIATTLNRSLVLNPTAGNVGIGTTTPSEILDILSSNKDTFVRTSNGTAYAVFGINNTNNIARLGTTSNHSFEFITNNTFRFKVTSGGLVGIGVSNPLGTFDVRSVSNTLSIASVAGTTTNAALLVDNNGTGDIFAASKSGAAKFTILNNGDIQVANLVSCDTIDTDANGIFRCGTDSQGVGAINYFQLNNGAISPFSTTADLLIGGIATNSAKFAFINSIGSGTPTASIAGATTNNALYLNGDGRVATTNKQSLTLGSPDTGNVVLEGSRYQFTNLVGCDTIDADANGFLSCGTDSGGGGGAGIINVQNNSTPVGTNVDTLNFGTQFTVSASPLSTANIAIAADALNFSEFADSLTLDAATGVALSNFDLTLGTNAGNGTVFVSPNAGGRAALIVNKQGGNDIFTASASGTTRFTIANNGTITANAYTTAGGLLYANGSGVISQTSAGSSSQCLIGGATPTWGSCDAASAAYWQLNSGALAPGNTTYDLLVGGISTASAKFAVINTTGTGTPTASVSAGTSGASYLTAAGVLGTTANQSLTLGSATTGNLIFAPGGNTLLTALTNGRIGIGTTTPLATLDVRGASATIPVASFSGNTNFAAAVVDQSGTGDIFTASASGQSRFVIAQNGRVGVGTTAPNTLLDLNRTIAAAPARLGFSSLGSTLWGVGLANNSTRFSILSNNSTAAEFFSILPSGSIGIGNISPFATLDVVGNSATTPVASFSASTNFAAALVDQSGTGDLFTASKSGATKFTILNNGDVRINKLTTAGGLLYTTSNGTLAQLGAGTLGQCLTSNGSGNAPSYTNCAAGLNYWQSINAGTITPYNTTVDLLVGGTSTASAKFALVNVAGGTPTASIAGTVTNVNTYLDGNGNFGTTNGQTLSFGGASTGNIILTPLNGNGTLTVNGTTTMTGGLTVAQTAGSLVCGANCRAFMGTTTDLGAYLNVGGGTTNRERIIARGVAGQTADMLQLQNSTGAITSGFNANGQLYIQGLGNTTPNASIAGASTFSSLVVDNSGTGDILTASKGGATKFVIKNNGDLSLANYTNCAMLTTSGTTLTCSSLPAATTNYFDQKNGLTYVGNLTSDFAVGGLSSASAKFKVSVSGTNPTASVSGLTSSAALLVDNAGTGALFTASKSGATKFIVDNAGNVGIGTALPTSKLEIKSPMNSASSIKIINSATANPLFDFFETTAGHAQLGMHTVSGAIGVIFRANGDSYLNGGDLGVGTSASPLARLDVRGSSATTPVASFSGSTGMAAMVVDQSNVGDIFTASSSGQNRFVITNSGNVGIGTNQPAALLSIKGLAGQSNNRFEIRDSSNSIITQIDSNGALGQTGRLAVGSLSTTLAKFYVGQASTDPGQIIRGSSLNNSDLLQIQNQAGTNLATFNTNGQLTITGQGNTAPNASISGASTFASMLVDNSGNGDIFTASKSGASKFTVKNNGDVQISNFTSAGVIQSNAQGVLSASTATVGNGGVLATLDGVETFTNKTLTAPKFADLGFIADPNGNELLVFDSTATAVNEITIRNATTTNGPSILSSGGDTNIALNVDGKGSGALNLNGTATGNILLGGGSASTGCTVTNATGAFACTAAITGSNLSGTNTGDQTITLTGDVTGSGTGSFATTIADNSVDGTDLALGSDTTGDLMYYNGTDWVRLAAGTSTQTLHSGSTPSWAAIGLTTDVSGILPIANGGTNSTATPTLGGIAYGTGTAYAFSAAGSAGQCLTSNGAAAPTWGTCGGGGTFNNYWQFNNGALAPFSTTADLLIGGTSTTSAKIAFINVNNGTPTASISAIGGSNSALVLGANSTIQSVKNQTLTIGGNSTGNIQLTPNNGSGVINANGNLNLATTKTYQIAGVDVLSATTLGANVVNSSLTQVGALNAGSIASGFGAIDVGSDAISGGNLTGTGTTGITLSGAGAGAVFSGTGTHTISASTGTLQFGAATLTGAITGNSQNITGLNQLGVGSLTLSGTTVASTGDINLNATGGDIIFADTNTINIGGNGADVAYNVIGDSTANKNSANVTSDNDLYVDGSLEVDGTVLIGSTTNGLSFDPATGPSYLGTARPTKTISLQPEYSGAVLTAFRGGGTDTNITGVMTSDVETSATNSLRNYYQWTSSVASLNMYTVAVKVRLPKDFSAWATSNALEVEYVTSSTSTANNFLDTRVYLESDSTTAVAATTNSVSAVANTWTTVTIDDSVLDDAVAPEWDAAGEQAIIYLRMGALSSNTVRVGEIRLNYLSAF